MNDREWFDDIKELVGYLGEFTFLSKIYSTDWASELHIDYTGDRGDDLMFELANHPEVLKYWDEITITQNNKFLCKIG